MVYIVCFILSYYSVWHDGCLKFLALCDNTKFELVLYISPTWTPRILVLRKRSKYVAWLVFLHKIIWGSIILLTPYLFSLYSSVSASALIASAIRNFVNCSQLFALNRWCFIDFANYNDSCFNKLVSWRIFLKYQTSLALQQIGKINKQYLQFYFQIISVNINLLI